jgi:hypothetical protein
MVISISTLSRWRHGFESRWGCFVIPGEGRFLLITLMRLDATAVVVVSSTQITAVTGGPAKVGTWNLFVITPGGTSTANAGDDYRYY